MKFRVEPPPNDDGTPVTPRQRITWLRDTAREHDEYGHTRTARWCRQLADDTEAEARRAQEPRRWERHRS